MVESARLEIWYGFTSIVGSNPTLSATFLQVIEIKKKIWVGKRFCRLLLTGETLLLRIFCRQIETKIAMGALGINFQHIVRAIFCYWQRKGPKWGPVAKSAFCMKLQNVQSHWIFGRVEKYKGRTFFSQKTKSLRSTLRTSY